MSIESRALHQRLHAAIEQRRPRGNLVPAQIMRLKMLKLIEEVTEAHTCIETGVDPYGSPQRVRQQFDDRDWLRAPWTYDPELVDVAGLKAELADVYVVLASLECELAALTGQEWDLQAAAEAKALADVDRR